MALMVLRAGNQTILTGRKYWNKRPLEVLAMRRKKLEGDRVRRQRRKRRQGRRRFPVGSHRRN